MFSLSRNQERLGEIIIFSDVLLSAAFPVIIHAAPSRLPPIFFAGITVLLAAITLFPLLLWFHQLKDLAEKKAWVPALIVTFSIVVFPSILIYQGTRLTSATNTSLLLTAEIPFVLLFSALAGEKMDRWKIGGGLLVMLGALLVLFNGHLGFNRGDLMILLASAFYPLGNIYAKKALRLISPSALAFIRSFLGALVLLIISFWAEKISGKMTEVVLAVGSFWWLLLLNGVLIAGLSKILWYEGLKRVDVTKATIMIMSYPAFSLILAAAFLHETPTLYQVGGLLLIFAGLYAISGFRLKDTPYVT